MIHKRNKKALAAREKRFAKQRAKRGFSDDELWNFDATIARWLIPRLTRFRQIKKGHPGHMTTAQWTALIDQMIAGFRVVAGSTWPYHGTTDERIAQRGLDAFYKNFRHLWD